MCDPISMAVVMGGTALVQGMGQKSAMEQTNAIKKDLAAQNVANAIEARGSSLEQAAVRRNQEQAAAGQQGRVIAQKAALARGAERAGAASAGVEGVTPDEAVADFDLQEAFAMAALNKQDQMAAQAMSSAMESDRARTQGRIIQSAPQLGAVPTMLGIGMNAAAGALGGYSMGMNMTQGGTVSPFSGGATQGGSMAGPWNSGYIFP